ncbi:MAG: uracil-DNA glycosylase family protein [Candidatus Dormibacteria bacterium]
MIRRSTASFTAIIESTGGRSAGIGPDGSPTFPDGTAESLRALQIAHRACRRCVDAGFLPAARPVFSGRPGQRILLIGQAPGPVEHDVARPFSGRAGRQLIRWMVRAGFTDEADFRDRVYITSMTTCFPGRRPDGSGDRPPGAPELALCRPWRDSLIELLTPRLVVTVGALAAARYLPGRRLDDLVGTVFTEAGSVVDGAHGPIDRLVLPLPHPSGQSRWLNDTLRARRLEVALQHLHGLVPWAEASGRQCYDPPRS